MSKKGHLTRSFFYYDNSRLDPARWNTPVSSRYHMLKLPYVLSIFRNPLTERRHIFILLTVGSVPPQRNRLPKEGINANHTCLAARTSISSLSSLSSPTSANEPDSLPEDSSAMAPAAGGAGIAAVLAPPSISLSLSSSRIFRTGSLDLAFLQNITNFESYRTTHQNRITSLNELDRP